MSLGVSRGQIQITQDSWGWMLSPFHVVMFLYVTQSKLHCSLGWSLMVKVKHVEMACSGDWVAGWEVVLGSLQKEEFGGRTVWKASVGWWQGRREDRSPAEAAVSVLHRFQPTGLGCLPCCGIPNLNPRLVAEMGSSLGWYYLFVPPFTVLLLHV